MLRVLSLLVLIGFAFGCGDDPAHSLRVEVRTDLVATIEFDRFVLTGESGESLSVPTSSVDFGTDWTSPRLMGDVATTAGTRRFRAELRLGESTVVGRDLLVSVEGRTGLSLVLTRDCSDVICGADEACLAGQCVTQGCLSGLESECEFAPECTDDVECVASVACAPLACESPGFCFPRSFDCEANEYCDPVLDCQPLPGFEPDAGFDGGTTDSGVDAGVVSPDAGFDAGVDSSFDAGIDAGPPTALPFTLTIGGATAARDLALSSRGGETCLAYAADGTATIRIEGGATHSSGAMAPRMELLCLDHPSPLDLPTVAWDNFAERAPLSPPRLACGDTLCGIAAEIDATLGGFTLVRADEETAQPISTFRNRNGQPLLGLGATDNDALLFAYFDTSTDTVWLRSLSGGTDAPRASFMSTGGTLSAISREGDSVFMAGTWEPGATLPAGARLPMGMDLATAEGSAGMIALWATAYDAPYSAALFATDFGIVRPLASTFVPAGGASEPRFMLLVHISAGTAVTPPIISSVTTLDTSSTGFWVLGVDAGGALRGAQQITLAHDGALGGAISFVGGADPHVRVAVHFSFGGAEGVHLRRLEQDLSVPAITQGTVLTERIDDVLILDHERTLIAGATLTDEFLLDGDTTVNVRSASAAYVYQHVVGASER